MFLQRIEAFLTVARTGNVSRAAEELFVTQPALTARLRALEADLTFELFVRTNRGMRLTEAGRLYLPYAERAVAALREGEERLRQVLLHDAGTLTLGAAPGVSTYALPPMLARFSTQFPNVEISVRTGHSEEVLDMVLREEVQLGLGRDIRHPDIERIVLYEDELVLVVGAAHPLRDRDRVTLSDLEPQQLILFDRESSYYELTRALFSAAGIMIRRTIQLDNIEAAKRMVELGLGVALLPQAAVVRDVDAGSLVQVAVSGSPPIRRPIVASRRRDLPPYGAAEHFLRVAMDAITTDRIAAQPHVPSPAQELPDEDRLLVFSSDE